MSNNIKAILFDEGRVVDTYASVEDAYAAAAFCVADPDDNTSWEDLSVSVVRDTRLDGGDRYVVIGEAGDGHLYAQGLTDVDSAIERALYHWGHLTNKERAAQESFAVDVIRYEDDFIGEYVDTAVDFTERQKIPFRYILREQIERLGKSQRAVAEMLHVPLRTVENWLAGINEPDEFKANAVVEKLAEAIFEAE